jgi:hypothetical protein
MAFAIKGAFGFQGAAYQLEKQPDQRIDRIAPLPKPIILKVGELSSICTVFDLA